MDKSWIFLIIIIILCLMFIFNNSDSKEVQVGGWTNPCEKYSDIGESAVGPKDIGQNIGQNLGKADSFFFSPPDITGSCQRYGSPYPDRSSLIATSNNNGDCSKPKVANLNTIIHPGKVDQTYYYDNPCLTKPPYGTKTAGLEYMMNLGELNNELYRFCDEYGCPSSNRFWKEPNAELPARDYKTTLECKDGSLSFREQVRKRVKGEDAICPPKGALARTCAFTQPGGGSPSFNGTQQGFGGDAATTRARNDITEEMYHNPTAYCEKFPDHPRCAIFSGLFTPFVGPVIYTNKSGDVIGNGLPPMDKVSPIPQPQGTNVDGFCLETDPFCQLNDTRGTTILQSQMLDPRC